MASFTDLLRSRAALWIRLALIVTLAGALVFAWVRSTARMGSHGTASASGAASDAALPADYPRDNAPAPEFQLVDQAGGAFEAARLLGSPTIVAFVFAHCQTICPGLVRDVREAAEQVGPDDVRLVLITLDPVRDSPAALPQIASDWRLGPSEWLLSGEPAEVERLLDAFGVARQRDAATGEVVHPPLVVVLDGEGRQSYRLNAPSVAWIVEAVRRSRDG